VTNIIEQFEKEQLSNKKTYNFNPGDTVAVEVKIKEGERERLQTFEGVVIAKKNRGLNSSFTVRKISHGEGVERTFQTYSSIIANIIIKRHGDVRRAKLYYLRDRSGRSARIKEKQMVKKTPKVAKQSAKVEVTKKAPAPAKQAIKNETKDKETKTNDKKDS